MADPFSIVTGIFGVLEYAFTAGTDYNRLLTKISRSSPSPVQQKLRNIHGPRLAFCVTYLLPETIKQWERIDGLLSEKDEVLLAFQRSYTSDCTQTAVAVSNLSLHHHQTISWSKAS